MERNSEQSRNLAAKADVISFLARFPHEKIPGIYSLIDILVYPRYSMRLTELVDPAQTLEAMAMANL